MANDSKVALLCAYTLASAERYGEAEALILSDIELAKTAEALDLLARIRMEQGDVAEARRLWQEIQTIHPEHRPSAAALKAVARGPRKLSCRTVWWSSLAAALLAGCIFGGMCCSGGSREALATVTWDGLPGEAQLNDLAQYHGQAERVLISSAFFNHPKRVNHRAILTEYLASTLGVPTEAIYLGAPQAGQADGEIRLALEGK